MATISALGIGSGLDLNGLLDQLDAAEREKLVPIVRAKKSYEAKISAYGTLRSALAQFQSAANKLDKAGLFDSVKSSVAGTALTAAAGDGAQIGTYQVEVSQLARAYSVATVGIADKTEDLGAGTVTINLANGDSFSVELTSEFSSLKDVRDKINALDAGVNASIVNDGSGTPYRLALSSSETGTDSAIASVDFGALATSLSLDATTEVTPLNAMAKVNGVDVVSQSNQLEEAIEGMTLVLAEEGSATISVTSDTETLKKSVMDFVESYNKLQESMAELTAYNSETGDAGKLLGDSTTRSVESRLRNVFIDGVSEGELQQLSDIGISLQLDGSLEVNEDTLDDLLVSDRRALGSFFAGSGDSDGFADKLDTTLDTILKDNGLLKTATNGLDSRIDSLDDQYDRVDQNIARTIARYQTQFGQLDSTIGRMNSTSSYIAQQFDMLNAQLNQ